ncbi:MAG: cation transporter [Elusimicrobia bacterium]|nr:cation transporter [Elusimicrobiota bacterium]
MKILLLALALASSASAAPVTTREFTELPPGRYTIALTGLLSTVCGRAISAEWAKLPEVDSASVNFDKSEATVSVRLNHTLKVASLHKTLRRAERLANLGGHYDLRGIAYKLGK